MTDTDIVVAKPLDIRSVAQGEEISIQTFDERVVKASIMAVSELVPGAAKGTDLERAAYLALCVRLKTDPFSRMVHFMKIGTEPVAMIVNYMLYHERACKHPQYDGYESGIIWSVDGKAVRGKVCDYINGKGVSIIGGWCKVWRKDRSHPVDVEVPWSEAAKTKRDGTLNRNWAGQPTTMMVKVPESRALRKAFPDYFSGTYTDVEPIMPPDDTIDAAVVLPRDERTLPEPESKTPLQLLGDKINGLILAELPDIGEVDRGLTREVLLKAATRTTGKPVDDFLTGDAWTDKLVVDVNKMLDEFGLDPEWLPEVNTDV